MKLKNCHNINSFKHLAKKTSSPIFNYIDGAADDEVTPEKHKSFDDVDLVPNVLRGVEDVDLTTTVLEKKLICQSIVHQPQFNDFFISKVKRLLLKLQVSLGQCLVYHLLAL